MLCNYNYDLYLKLTKISYVGEKTAHLQYSVAWDSYLNVMSKCAHYYQTQRKLFYDVNISK